MSTFDQIGYYEQRMIEQQGFAERARDPDIVAFHTNLAAHYRGLAEAAQLLALPRETGSERLFASRSRN